MKEEQYNQLKSKMEKMHQKENGTKQNEEKKIQINTEKVYHQIWKYIIKNMHKGDVDILIYIKESLTEEKAVLYTMKVNSIPKKVTYIKIDHRQLIHLLLSDDLYVHLGGKQGEISPLTIYASMAHLKKIVEKQKQKNLK